MANTSNRGFASMDPEEQKEIASKGGRAAQESGHAHRLTEDERSKGGQNSPGNFKNDPERARRAGSKGGQVSHGIDPSDRSEMEDQI